MLDWHAYGYRIKSNLSLNHFLVIVIVNMLQIGGGGVIIVLIVISASIFI
jgi:hypothetical protein